MMCRNGFGMTAMRSSCRGFAIEGTLVQGPVAGRCQRVDSVERDHRGASTVSNRHSDNDCEVALGRVIDHLAWQREKLETYRLTLSWCPTKRDAGSERRADRAR
jgi:hypothetical protein